jgi:hypothetical protein
MIKIMEFQQKIQIQLLLDCSCEHPYLNDYILSSTSL